MTRAEINHIIERNADPDKRGWHSRKEFHQLMNDYHYRWGVNYPYDAIETDVIGIGNRSMSRDRFRELFGKYRTYIKTGCA